MRAPAHGEPQVELSEHGDADHCHGSQHSEGCGSSCCSCTRPGYSDSFVCVMEVLLVGLLTLMAAAGIFAGMTITRYWLEDGGTLWKDYDVPNTGFGDLSLPLTMALLGAISVLGSLMKRHMRRAAPRWFTLPFCVAGTLLLLYEPLYVGWFFRHTYNDNDTFVLAIFNASLLVLLCRSPSVPIAPPVQGSKLPWLLLWLCGNICNVATLGLLAVPLFRFFAVAGYGFWPEAAGLAGLYLLAVFGSCGCWMRGRTETSAQATLRELCLARKCTAATGGVGCVWLLVYMLAWLEATFLPDTRGLLTAMQVIVLRRPPGPKGETGVDSPHHLDDGDTPPTPQLTPDAAQDETQDGGDAADTAERSYAKRWDEESADGSIRADCHADCHAAASPKRTTSEKHQSTRLKKMLAAPHADFPAASASADNSDGESAAEHESRAASERWEEESAVWQTPNSNAHGSQCEAKPRASRGRRCCGWALRCLRALLPSDPARLRPGLVFMAFSLWALATPNLTCMVDAHTALSAVSVSVDWRAVFCMSADQLVALFTLDMAAVSPVTLKLLQVAALELAGLHWVDAHNA